MYMEIRKTDIFIMPFSCSCGLFAGRVARLFKPDSRPGIQLLSYLQAERTLASEIIGQIDESARNLRFDTCRQ